MSETQVHSMHKTQHNACDCASVVHLEINIHDPLNAV